MGQFEESEVNAVEEKKKRLHYESIRIEEIKKETSLEKDTLNSKLDEISQQVFEISKPH